MTCQDNGPVELSSAFRKFELVTTWLQAMYTTDLSTGQDPRPMVKYDIQHDELYM